MIDRTKAHELILTHALEAGVQRNEVEMAHFARELFLLSRQCGAAGLAEESKRMFALSRTASTDKRSSSWDFKIYAIGANTIGWISMGSLSEKLDVFRG